MAKPETDETMCGIAGIIDYAEQAPLNEAVVKMTDAIGHRGPDGRGSFVRGNVALGHARLSIIDLEGGRQPMSTPDDLVHLTYNGEIYNYKDLRTELEGKGYRFQTSSDTEVILYSYEAWGKNCVRRFEGMFAFAVADFRKQELFLARDHFGIKPLLYRVSPNSFAFASEFRSLQCLPDWSGEIDLCSIDLYLRFQYIPSPRTAYRKVFKLPAGHCMTVRMRESFQKIERHWQPDFSPKHQRKWSKERLVDELDESLRDSVRRHLVSDVPFGAFLSGGIDSSLVVGYMAEILDAPVKTFSIGFEEESVNELPYARQIAHHYKTDHREEIVRFDALKILPEIVRHYGEPFGDQSAIPTWHVCQLARSAVPMVLSGDGGDEFFGGYPTYGSWLDKVAMADCHRGNGWRDKVRPIARAVLPKRYPARKFAEDAPEYWLSCITRFVDRFREPLWRSDYRFLSDQSEEHLSSAFQRAAGATGMNRVQQTDVETFLPDDILGKVDIASMRFGLEVRPPILDRRVFELARSIAPRALYSSEQGVFCGKLPLRELAARKLGREFAFRSKQGFGMPLQAWFDRRSPESDEIQGRLLDPGAKIARWFDQGFIEQHIRGRENVKTVHTWMLLVLEEWMIQQSQDSSVGTSGTTAALPATSL